MFCSTCGKQLSEGSRFCPHCGNQTGNTENQDRKKDIDTPGFKLGKSDKRAYEIEIKAAQIIFQGKFWYLENKEFKKCRIGRETALAQKFIGMGYLAKRSYRKCLQFVLLGSALEVLKAIVDTVSGWIDKANNYLRWIDREISLPDGVNIAMNTLAVICLLLAVMYLFSKKKMIEISFVDKRICVPEKSMSQQEYSMLYHNIISAKKA